MSHDSPWTRFLVPNISVKYVWVTHNGDIKYRWGRLKPAIFDECLAVSQKWCKIGTLLLQKANMNLDVFN